MKVLVVQSLPTQWTVVHPSSSVHGILQARTLEGVAIPPAGDLPDPGIKSRSHALQADSLPCEPPGKPNKIMKENLTGHCLMTK